jgi:hypothetical protein
MLRKTLAMISTIGFISSCSVQQFGVNTQVKPFENGGKVWGERIEKCGVAGWKKTALSGYDVHLLGLNIHHSNTQQLADSLKATSYTIETKSNVWVELLTFRMVDVKKVTVIKRDH